MRAQNFAGSFGTGGGQNVFSSTRQQRDDPFGAGTPAPKPNIARRLGTSLMGGIANPTLRSSGNDPSFSSINLPRVAQEQFKQIGERAGDQEVANYNRDAEEFNLASKSAKEAEIANYESQVNSLNTTYDNRLNAYNSAVNNLNNQYANALSLYNAEVSGYETYQPEIRELNKVYDDYQFYIDVVYGANPRGLNRNDYVYYLNRDKKRFEDSQKWFYANRPSQFRKFYSGTFTSDDLGPAPVRGSLPKGVVLPTRPTLPDAPDPIYEQRQMREELPDRIERKLASGQREIVGGDLPPQVSSLTGDSFSQAAINYGSTPYRQISELNQSEQVQLGLPKAYQVRSGFVAQVGNNQSYGGQVFNADQITNSNSTHFYIPGLGWTPRASLIPLY